MGSGMGTKVRVQHAAERCQRVVQQPAASALHSVDKGFDVTRREAGRFATRVQLRIKALRVSLDPSTKHWAGDARKRLNDEDFSKHVERQPSPEELAETWRKGHNSQP
jgi:hypothetical protein